MLHSWSVQWRENGHVTEVVTLMEGEWTCHGDVSLMEGSWSCYRGGQFNVGRMVMLQKSPV